MRTRKTTCSKCGNPVEPTRVHRYSYCRKCHAAYMRATRPKHSQLSDEQRLKANVRAIVKYYIKIGTVQKLNCSVCNSPRSEAHHEDYSKPLEVIWLCRPHHLERHGYPQNIISLQDDRN